MTTRIRFSLVLPASCRFAVAPLLPSALWDLGWRNRSYLEHRWPRDRVNRDPSEAIYWLLKLLSRRRQWHPTPVLLPGKSHGWRSLVGLQSMGSLRVRHDWATSLSLFTFHFLALEKEMATHSSVLAWRIPGTGEPGGLPSMGSYRVGHDWCDLAAAAAAAGKYRWLSLLGNDSLCGKNLS